MRNNKESALISSNSLNIEYALFLGKTYMIGVGVFTGTMSFELTHNSNGEEYTIPSKAQGSTYGAIYSIRFQLSDHVHMGVELKSGRGDIKGTPDSSTLIKNSSVESFSVSNAFMGYTF